ncbi:MAG: hypothetical protein EA393_00875 [Bacteroidetes bacterium]|nr:MAG: hypothetical protein EA393_00875 [Bacteroidota bacterium]
MKKKFLTLGLFVLLTFGFSKVADADFSNFECISFITSCGHPAVACGSSAEQIIHMMLLAESYYCNRP